MIRKSAGSIIIEALELHDAGRERSLQTQLGVSSLGGCRAQAWLQLRGAPKTNVTDHLEAIMGTAFHAVVTKALDEYSYGSFRTEFEVSHNGLLGHMDWYWEAEREVVDVKTMKKANAGYFPKLQQRWQVHTYGYLTVKNSLPVEWVSLVAFMRDGGKADKIETREPYSPQIAEDALAWLADLESRKTQPAPELPAETFCKRFCEYYGSSCMGLEKNPRKTGARW